MGYMGINLGNVKSNNRSAVLKLLNDRGAMSRKDIAVALGLTPATVTLICADLFSAGVLVEEGELAEVKRAGRKKILVGIHYESRFVLCISLESNDTSITVCDMRGKRLATRTIQTDTDVPGEVFLSGVADIGKAMLWEQGISREMVLGVGVTTPGLVDHASGVATKAYRMWNAAVNVCDCLKKHLDYPIILENNVKAFAGAELIYGSGKDLENILLVKWGPGVGSALITHRQIHEGSFNRPSAELGHVTVQRGGKPCRCGRQGCLETVVSAHAIASQLRELCSAEKTPRLYALAEGDINRIVPRTIRNWVNAEDALVQQTVLEDIDQMARVISNVATFWVPDRVIVYGDMFMLPNFYEKFVECCTYYDPTYNMEYIMPSALNDCISYIGPLAVVVREKFFEGQS